MPIDYRIDPQRRLVWADAKGLLTAQELFDYQQAVWSRPDVQGFDELVDMRAVTEIAAPSPAVLRALATLSASMDSPRDRSKFAIIAPDDLAYGLGRMYQVYRGLGSSASKEVAVFRTIQEGLDWLGLPPRSASGSPGPI
jgi:hypothetical protein